MLRVLMYLVPLALTVYAFIDCLNTPEDEAKHLPKIAWVFIILLFSPIGWIAWYVAGRPQAVRAGGTWRPGSGFPERERPRAMAPDDDPAFLREIARNRRDDEEMFSKWEADLRRREEELRRRGEEPPAS